MISLLDLAIADIMRWSRHARHPALSSRDELVNKL
jgi:hypothetical protein